MSTVIVANLYVIFIACTLSSRRQLRVCAKLLSAVESRRDGLRVAQDVVLGTRSNIGRVPSGTAECERARFQPPLAELVRFVGLPRTVIPGCTTFLRDSTDVEEQVRLDSAL
jgi:hypothetical protein